MNILAYLLAHSRSTFFAIPIIRTFEKKEILERVFFHRKVSMSTTIKKINTEYTSSLPIPDFVETNLLLDLIASIEIKISRMCLYHMAYIRLKDSSGNGEQYICI